MFNFLDSCTLICGGGGDVNTNHPAAPVQENDAELSLKQLDEDGVAEEEILDPVDPMDTNNYLVAHLTLPMGILFEENDDEEHGGAFVSEINEGCSAAADGTICRGDQLIAIGQKRVSGMDFGEVMKLILDNAEAKTKLSFFRGPAESLYGPLGASVEWLDEFVAERGEEAALVEDSESEALPDAEHVSAPHDLLDDIALAASAVSGDAVGENFFSAYQTLLDADTESNLEKELIATKEEEASVVVQNDVDVIDVQQGGGEAEVEEVSAVVENEAEADVGVALEAEVGAVATAEDDTDGDEEIASDTVPAIEAPVLNDAVYKASKDWIGNYLANPESQSVSNARVDAGMADESTVDLDARCKKAVELKEAALAAVVENERSNSYKGILKEPRYSPKGVDEIKMFEADPVSNKEPIDEDSATSSVWSEPDEYIGQVDEEVPEKRVGSSLAALGVASTLTTNMMSA